jgi:hypothetical protein
MTNALIIYFPYRSKVGNKTRNIGLRIKKKFYYLRAHHNHKKRKEKERNKENNHTKYIFNLITQTLINSHLAWLRIRKKKTLTKNHFTAE